MHAMQKRFIVVDFCFLSLSKYTYINIEKVVSKEYNETQHLFSTDWVNPIFMQLVKCTKSQHQNEM